MRYILKVLPVLPAAAAAAAGIYGLIYRSRKGKRAKPSGGRVAAEYLLTGWFVMFIFVTQIMPFGNGMGTRINLQPLHMFYIAYRYGSANASGVWQFLLNIIMFVPLGILFPLVFRRYRSWPKAILVSFLISLATELLQVIPQRGTDIDDVIANTVGGMCGFSLLLLVLRISDHKRKPGASGRKAIAPVMVLCLTALPFVSVKLSDGSSKYGNLYYGHLIPEELDVQCDVSDRETVRDVYRYKERIQLSALEQELQKNAGIQGTWTAGDGKDMEAVLTGDDGACIYVYPYHTWMVNYAVPETSGVTLEEDTLVQKAWDGLHRFGIDERAVSFLIDDRDAYGDSDVHLMFQSKESTDDLAVHGSIEVSLTKDGKLKGINDRRVYCQRCDRAECISASKSLDIAGDVGAGPWPGRGVVTDILQGYAFIPETGSLIPTWQIDGYLVCSDGSEIKWEPEIDAVE